MSKMFFSLKLNCGSELKKLKFDTKDTTTKTKGELELLKKKLIEIEGLIQEKNQKLIKNIQKQKLTLYSVQKLIEASDVQLYGRCQVALEYSRNVELNNI